MTAGRRCYLEPLARTYSISSGNYCFCLSPLRPSQSFGYEEDGRGKLVLQDGPSVIYSGTKNDRIAPNHYFENNVGGTAKVGTIGFGLSKTRRKVFEAVGNEKVGPGRYTPQVRQRSEVTPNQEGSSAFLSKTPMAHQKGMKTETKTV